MPNQASYSEHVVCSSMSKFSLIDAQRKTAKNPKITTEMN